MVELGWLTFTMPEADGGLGQPFNAAAVLYHELGKVLSPLPLMQVLVGVQAITHLSDEYARKALSSKVPTGDFVVTLREPGTDPIIAKSGNAIEINGVVPGFIHDERSTHLLLDFILEGERRYAVMPIPGMGAVLTSRPTWDQSRKICDIEFAGTAVTTEDILPKAVNWSLEGHFDLAIACDSIGGAEALLAETIAYMSTRQQFGRAIASFQALKHRCAEHKVKLEAARVFVEDAVLRFSALIDRGSITAAAGAKLCATTVYRRIAEDAIQLHGGIGFSWAHDCHLFLKRALLNEVLGGSPEAYRDRIAAPLIEQSISGLS